LLLVSDEVRAQASRGSDTARDAQAALAEVGNELAQLNVSMGAARDTTTDVAQEAARVASACSDAEAALVDIRDRLKKTTGSDPETVRAIAETAEKARALVTSLGALSGKVPKTLLLSALRPMLEPLARLLAEEEGDGSGEPEETGG
jgi:hypothetical protein